MIVVISCLHGAYGLPFLGKNIASMLSYPWRREVVLLFFIFSDGGHSLYWRRIWGRLWTKSCYWWTLYIKFKKICSNKKMTTVESRKQKWASIILHQHTLSYTTGRQEVVGNSAFPITCGWPRFFFIFEKLTAVNSYFLFSFPFRHPVSMFVRVGPLRR